MLEEHLKQSFFNLNDVVKRVALKILAGYQCCISPFLGYRCRYYPSCSEYARELFLFQNPFYATLKSFNRILTCNPFFKGGIAYPTVSLQFRIHHYKPCLVCYWLVPLRVQKYHLSIPKGVLLIMQTCLIVKVHSKVSCV